MFTKLFIVFLYFHLNVWFIVILFLLLLILKIVSFLFFLCESGWNVINFIDFFPWRLGFWPYWFSSLFFVFYFIDFYFCYYLLYFLWLYIAVFSLVYYSGSFCYWSEIFFSPIALNTINFPLSTTLPESDTFW